MLGLEILGTQSSLLLNLKPNIPVHQKHSARSEANAAYLKLNGSLTYFTTDGEAGLPAYPGIWGLGFSITT